MGFEIRGTLLVDSFAPIAVFAYNRPQHLNLTLQSLSRCPEWPKSQVIIYSDGPRGSQNEAAVAKVRTLARSLEHSAVEIVERDENLGLANSIIRGVSDACERFGRAIVVEDDLIVAPTFLSYLNRALDVYAQRRDVYQVSAHMFDVPEFLDRRSTILLPITTTWGWATWGRAWRDFRVDAHGWDRLKSDRDGRKRFNLGNNYDYYSMLRRQMSGKRDSWGVRWYWTVFAAGGLSCFPPQSLVRNSGMDGSGTHGRGTLRRFRGPELVASVPEFCIPRDAGRCSDIEFAAVQRAIWRQNGGWRGWAMDRARAAGRRLHSVWPTPEHKPWG